MSTRPPETTTQQAYDRSLKVLLRRDPHTVARLALGDPSVHVLDMPRIGEEPLTVAPRTDGAVRVEARGEQGVLHVEFQRRMTAGDLGRFEVYNVTLSHALGEPVHTVVILLGPPACALPGVYERRAFGDWVHRFHYGVVRLYEMPAAELSLDPGLAPLAPLGRGATVGDVQAAAGVVRASPTPDPRLRAERLAILHVLGKKRLGAAVGDIITTEEVRMTDIFQMGWLEGHEEGIEKGIEKGIAHERRLLRRLLTLAHGDAAAPVLPLLDRCGLDDLEWLGVALFTERDPVALHQRLRQRLGDG